MLRRQNLPLSVIRSSGRVIASALIMGVAVYLIRSWPLALVVIAGAVVYDAALLALRTLDAEEWSIFRSGLRGR
jgi:hypothetical protein